MEPEGIIRVYGDEYQFAGSSTVLMEVEDVTDDKILGYRYWENFPQENDEQRMVLNRSEIVGWSDY